jgi:cytoskeletal protein CcmA (bactofilin family)
MENSNFEPVKENIGKSQLFVESGLKVKVNVSECDTLRFEGDVEGSVKAKRLFMSESGRFLGTAEVESAEVEGLFEGTLTVSGLLRVGKTGRVSGKLRYAEIQIERNGQISGDISTVEAEPASSHSNESDLDSDTTSVNQISELIAKALQMEQIRHNSDRARNQHSWSDEEADTKEVKARKGFFGLVMGLRHAA